MMRTLTALALVLATTSFAYAERRHHDDLSNDSFILQAGSGDNAFVFQKGGHNKSGIVSWGRNDNATVIQVADPRGKGKNNSFVGQFGGGNSNALVFQDAERGATNNALTIQTGWGDWAGTVQGGGKITNNATTMQFGNNDHALTIQVK